MAIPQNVIDDIHSRVSLVNLVSKYIEVEGTGPEAMACCPFHKEKTPSLSISDEKGLFHCFGCGASGNASQFLMQYKKIDFIEAIDELAAIAGVDLSPYKGKGSAPAVASAKRETEPAYLLKLRSNLEQFQDCSDSMVITTYRMSDDGKRQHERETYYPPMERPGTPAYALSARQLRYYREQSLNNRRMIYAGISLFGEKSSKNKDTGLPYKSKASDNATYCLSVSLEVDNTEFKGGRDKPEYKNIDNRDKFLAETKRTMLSRIDAKLDELGLTDYAAVLDSGTGYHVHLILDNPESYRDLDAASEFEKYGIGEYHERVLASLILAFGADPQTASRTSTLTLIPGVTYWKLGQPRTVTVVRDARQFLTFRQVYEKTLISDTMGALEKRFKVYSAAYKLFEKIGRIPPDEFVEALCAHYEKAPSKEVVLACYEDYMKHGILPGKEASDTARTYNGKELWPCGDGSTIKITKKYEMEYLTHKKKVNSEGDTEFDPQWVRIPCSYALIPLYKIEHGDGLERETPFEIVYDCIRAGESRRITIPGDRFGSPDSIQRALRLNQLDITLNTHSARALYSYSLTFAKPIRNASVGINYIRDDDGEIVDSFLVGYDFFYRDKTYHKVKRGIVELPDEATHIDGFDMKNNNELRRRKIPADIIPAGKLDELCGKVDRLFVSPMVSRAFLGFLGMSMLREPIYEITQNVPFLSLHGTSGCGKSTLMKVAAGIFNQKLTTNKPTVSTMIKVQKYRRNGLILLDELDDNHLPHLLSFLKDCVENAYRQRQDPKTGTVIADDQILNTTIISTNHAIHRGGDPFDFRMLKIHFTKQQSVFDTDAHADLDKYVHEHGFEAYMDLYEHISKIDLKELESRIFQLKKMILHDMPKDARLAAGYASMIAVGEYLGIGLTYEGMLPFILSNESDAASDKDLLVSTLLSCAVDSCEGNTYPEWNAAQTNPDGTEKVPGGQVIPQMFQTTLKRLTDYMVKTNVISNADQKQVKDMLYDVTFVKVSRTTIQTQIKGMPVRENGMILTIDFGDETFSNLLQQNILCLYKGRSRGGKHVQKQTSFCRLPLPTEEAEPETAADMFDVTA